MSTWARERLTSSPRPCEIQEYPFGYRGARYSSGLGCGRARSRTQLNTNACWLGAQAMFAVALIACGEQRPRGNTPGATTEGQERAREAAVTTQPRRDPLLPRVVAYVNCLCGFGVGTSHEACLAEPDANINQIERWENAGESPITHYVIAFLSFGGGRIVTDDASVWTNGGGHADDFELDDHLRAALRAAQAHGKKVLLSLGGESGSDQFLGFWHAVGASRGERVQRMRDELVRVVQRFAEQNEVRADGFDLDLELGGSYGVASETYAATRDLIDAVPDELLVAFAPEVGNGLCAAPRTGDALPAARTLGGACEPHSADQVMWPLAQLDQDCKRADGTPKLDYFGVQYYNAGEDLSCGGGRDAAAMIRGTAQHYVNLANGWPASDLGAHPSWPAFGGLGASRLVLGKPGCRGCAETNYLDLPSMQQLIGQLDQRLDQPLGGVQFWDLCRVLGHAGGLCMGGGCQPSWGGKDTLHNLTELRRQMSAVRSR
jgi:hypothetical protein